MHSRKLKEGYRYLTWDDGLETIHCGPYAVGVLDALGFSSSIHNDGLLEVYRKYLTMLVSASLVSCTKRENQLTTLIMSDTILVCAPLASDPEDGILAVVSAVSTLLHNSITSIQQGFPVRGAIALGSAIVRPKHEVLLHYSFPYPHGNEGSNMVVRDGREPTHAEQEKIEVSVVLGEPIVKASKWERNQKWVGASLVPGSLAGIPSEWRRALDNLQKANLLIEWNVPTSEGLVRTSAVNYVSGMSADILLKVLNESVERAAHPRVAAKYLAAREFVSHIKDSGLYTL